MRVYVASKFENAEAVRKAIAELTAAGHEVTRDWTAQEHWDWDTPGATERLAWKYSYLDVEVVRQADVFIMLTYNGLSMQGAYVELGVALGLGKLVYIVGERPRSIFSYYPGVRVVESLEQVIEELRGV